MTDSNEVLHMIECDECRKLFPMTAKFHLVDIENRQRYETSMYSTGYPQRTIAERRVYCQRCFNDLVSAVYR